MKTEEGCKPRAGKGAHSELIIERGGDECVLIGRDSEKL